MITFKDMNETKEMFSGATEIIKKTQTLKSIYEYTQNINRKYLDNLNHLIGKNLNQPNKATDIHSWEKKNEYGHTHGYKLEISKAGIGATSSNRYQIEPYGVLFRDYDKTDEEYSPRGLIGDVIDNDEVFQKTLEYLNPKGKEILKILKEARLKTNISLPTETEIDKMIVLSDEEQKFYGLTNNKGIIEIRDSGSGVDFNLSVLKDNENKLEKTDLFEINDLELNNEKTFSYILFIINHKNEIDESIQEYIKSTKIDKNNWEKFDEELRENLAKYILLEKI